MANDKRLDLRPEVWRILRAIKHPTVRDWFNAWLTMANQLDPDQLDWASRYLRRHEIWQTAQLAARTRR